MRLWILAFTEDVNLIYLFYSAHGWPLDTNAPRWLHNSIEEEYGYTQTYRFAFISTSENVKLSERHLLANLVNVIQSRLITLYTIYVFYGLGWLTYHVPFPEWLPKRRKEKTIWSSAQHTVSHERTHTHSPLDRHTDRQTRLWMATSIPLDSWRCIMYWPDNNDCNDDNKPERWSTGGGGWEEKEEERMWGRGRIAVTKIYIYKGASIMTHV